MCPYLEDSRPLKTGMNVGRWCSSLRWERSRQPFGSVHFLRSFVPMHPLHGRVASLEQTNCSKKKPCLFSFTSRISAKMETVGSTVGSKTKSLFQSLKDKTEQLSTKRDDNQDPTEVAEKMVGDNCVSSKLLKCSSK